MENEGVAFGILTGNSDWAYFYILHFQRPEEMCIKVIKIRYTGFIISLSILKSNVGMN